MDAINRGFFYALLGTALVSLVVVLIDLRRSFRSVRTAPGVAVVLLLLFASQASTQAIAPPSTLPSDEEIRQVLAERVDRDRAASLGSHTTSAVSGCFEKHPTSGARFSSK